MAAYVPGHVSTATTHNHPHDHHNHHSTTTTSPTPPPPLFFCHRIARISKYPTHLRGIPTASAVREKCHPRSHLFSEDCCGPLALSFSFLFSFAVPDWLEAALSSNLARLRGGADLAFEAFFV